MNIDKTIRVALTLAKVIIMLNPVVNRSKRNAIEETIIANDNFAKKLSPSTMQAIIPTIINTIIQNVILSPFYVYKLFILSISFFISNTNS